MTIQYHGEQHAYHRLDDGQLEQIRVLVTSDGDYHDIHGYPLTPQNLWAGQRRDHICHMSTTVDAKSSSRETCTRSNTVSNQQLHAMTRNAKSAKEDAELAAQIARNARKAAQRSVAMALRLLKTKGGK